VTIYVDFIMAINTNKSTSSKLSASKTV